MRDPEDLLPVRHFEGRLRRAGVEFGAQWQSTHLTKENESIAVEAWLEAMTLGSADGRAWIAQAISSRRLSMSNRRRVYGALRQLFEESGDWSAGAAIELLGLKDIGDDLIRLLEPRYGHGRQRLAAALGRCKHPRAATVLWSLVDDGDLRGHALDGLKHAKWEPPSEEERKRLRAFAVQGPTWITRLAVRLLKDECPKRMRRPRRGELEERCDERNWCDAGVDELARSFAQRSFTGTERLAPARLWWPNEKTWVSLAGPSGDTVWLCLDGAAEKDEDCFTLETFAARKWHGLLRAAIDEASESSS